MTTEKLKEKSPKPKGEKETTEALKKPDKKAKKKRELPLLKTASKFPAMCVDVPEGDAVCWNGMESCWETWAGAPIKGKDLPDVGKLPTTAKFFGVVDDEDMFCIFDIFDPDQSPAKGAESRVSKLAVLKKVLGSSPSDNYCFLLAEKVGDAEGMEGVRGRFKNLRVL